MLAGRDRAKEEEERKEEKEEEPSRNPEVLESMDDALRNLLCRLGLSRAASSFEVEWYGSARTFIPDAWTHRRLLLEELEAVGRDSRLHREEVLEAEQILVRMQSEIRFRRLQQQKVWEQKRSLLRERRQLQEHLENSQEALRQLEEKHQAALRSKALLHLQRQRIQNLPEPDPIQEKPKEKLPPKSFCRRTEKHQQAVEPSGASSRNQLPVVQLHYGPAAAGSCGFCLEQREGQAEAAGRSGSL
ncbi:flagellar WD repeat-containing protein Pf20-like isoform X2 [Cyprinodon tularosa]|uniref:flagellar WD repeat-containing protein Pf20-like isoform X2 n=1 Tax=Cyprinodon tularosa TaxID=77115 RepID=UPI0018E257F8|nr:flagellar WD repeat-containing protein Pf20-like isoform X2 [Cyprinodon tularosa]